MSSHTEKRVGIIREEVNIADDDRAMIDDFDAIISVVERSPGEVSEQWKIVSLSIETFSPMMTPRELRAFGAWCSREGRRIGREYTSKGAKKP